ncbi:MAG: hypothetical protein LBG17_07050 [Bacteroidales bacterium]|nr:hypothetical protein [Bacteroidales bacterium]
MRKIVFCVLLVFPVVDCFDECTARSSQLLSITAATEITAADPAEQENHTFEELLLTSPGLTKRQKAEISVAMLEYMSFYDGLGNSGQILVNSIVEKASKNRIRLYPDLLSFFTTQKILNEYYPKNSSKWLQILDSLLSAKRLQNFNNLVTATKLLVKENTLYKTNTGEWIAAQLDFEIGSVGGVTDERNASKVVFEIKTTNVICRSNRDSIVIENTHGFFYPLENIFIGSGGKCYWLRNGISADTCFVSLSNYKINTNSFRIVCDTVEFVNKKLFGNKVLTGSFSDKLYSAVNAESATYPRFHTGANEKFLFKNIFDGVDIFGSFIQQGKRTVFGDDKNEAVLYIYASAKSTVIDAAPASILISKQFVLKDDKIFSPLAAMSIYLQNDSLYHSAAEIQYDNSEQIFRAANSAKINEHFPFITTYHNLMVDIDQLLWYKNKNEIEFGILHIPGTQNITSFKSLNYYNDSELEKAVGKMEVNPLYMLRQISQRVGDNEIMIYDISRAFALEPNRTKGMLLSLASLGFLNYNIEKETVTLLPKLFLYLDASAGKSNFDIIRIFSQSVNQAYGLINMDSLKLKIFGVQDVLLSEKRDVFFIPQNGIVTVGKDMNITFDGIVHGGRLDFVVKNAMFDYNNFRIDIPQIDTLMFVVKEFIDNVWDTNLTRRYVQVKSPVHSLSGSLFIDKPTNKGSIVNIPDYPMFKSTTPSFVHYEYPFIQNGVYLADSFYFMIDTFILKNLTELEAEELHLKGTFFSHSIFPPIKEDLRVMRDYSLGFVSTAPPHGWTLYNRALFFDTIQLDYSGLTGHGRISYLYSRTRASSIIFKPKEMLATAPEFSMMKDGFSATRNSAESFANADISYPSMTGENVTQQWFPFNGTYKVSTKDKLSGQTASIHIFEDSGWTFKGDYTFSENTSFGSGILSRKGEENFSSSEFLFGSNSFTAENVAFRVRNPKNRALLFDIANMSVNASLADGTASFTPSLSDEEYGAMAFFSANEYRAKAGDFKWKMNTHCIELNTERFVSTKKSSDSLQFTGKYASFCYRDTTLTVHEIKTINVADARIEPFGGEVKIFTAARIETLKNARLFFGNEDDTLYYFYNATVDILSSSKYRAEAFYDYRAPEMDAQSIFFSDIKPNAAGKTVSTTDVSSEEPMFLNNAFSYSGKLSFSSDNKFIYFNGYAKMRYGCDGETDSDKSEISFASYIDPSQVSIPISPQTRNRKGRPLRGGFYTDAKSGEPKYVFLDPVLSSDKPVLAVQSGFLRFSQDKNAYIISDSFGHDVLTWELKNCIASAVGNINLNLQTDKLKISFFGRLTRYENTGEIEIQATAAFDFFFNDALLRKLALMINTGMRTLPAAVSAVPYFTRYLQSNLSTREFTSVNKEMSSLGAYTKIPAKLNHTIMLSDLWMKWNENLNAYVSKGNIDIVSLGDNIVNKGLKMTINISRSRKRDIVDFYIEPDAGTWIYGNITDNVLQIISSDDDFNESLEAIKESKRKKRGFEYSLSTLRKKNVFLGTFEDNNNDGNSYGEGTSEGESNSGGEVNTEEEEEEEE